jgi:hypothetical protein
MKIRISGMRRRKTPKNNNNNKRKGNGKYLRHMVRSEDALLNMTPDSARETE